MPENYDNSKAVWWVFIICLFILFLLLTKKDKNSVYIKISIAKYNATSSQLTTIKSCNEKSIYYENNINSHKITKMLL